jgi:hypothetical protein
MTSPAAIARCGGIQGISIAAVTAVIGMERDDCYRSHPRLRAQAGVGPRAGERRSEGGPGVEAEAEPLHAMTITEAELLTVTLMGE